MNRPRCGYVLLEMMLVLGLSTVSAVLVGLVLHQVRQSIGVSNDANRRWHDYHELTRTFRHDVHQHPTAKIDPQGNLLFGDKIVYRRTETGLIRTENKSSRLFSVGDCEWTIETDQTVKLVIAPQPVIAIPNAAIPSGLPAEPEEAR